MKVVLIGYMASGKSIIASELSKVVDVDFIDLDDYISSKEKLTISEIFTKKGEIYFRILENKYLNEILTTKNNFVLAVGGGTPCYANNMELVLANTQSFFLRASIDTIFSRLVNEKENRPLVKTITNDKLKEFIAKHLFERNLFYEKANTIIKVDHKTIDEIVQEILLQIRN